MVFDQDVDLVGPKITYLVLNRRYQANALIENNLWRTKVD
jgi:hypothetical protein